MRVTIFGTGYVGLVTGTCLAEVGHDVICVDIDAAKVEGLNNGIIPIYEPGLEPMVKANHAAGRLNFTTDAAAAIQHGNTIFIAVGTPPDEDGSADLKYVLAVAKTIGQNLARPAVIVNKSTVPVGTADKVREVVAAQLEARGTPVAFDVASNPEFLKEGDAVNDCMRPDRIVIGASSTSAIEQLKRLYGPFNRNHERIVTMDVRSAELTKYAANAMLATKISFMNEMANIAERVGADIEHVRHGIGSDPRIGYSFIYPGAGYGGSCFPKDVQALERIAKQHGYSAQILEAIEAVNARQKHRLFELISDHYHGNIAGKTIAVWGLAFKPNTDDMRDSASIPLVQALLAGGAAVSAYDPAAMDQARPILPGIEFADDDAYSAAEGADALVIVTEWDEFRALDLARLAAIMRGRTLVDLRNVYDRAEAEEAGFAYHGLGRGRIEPADPGESGSADGFSEPDVAISR